MPSQFFVILLIALLFALGAPLVVALAERSERRAH
jgi:hypothetical protein